MDARCCWTLFAAGPELPSAFFWTVLLFFSAFVVHGQLCRGGCTIGLYMTSLLAPVFPLQGLANLRHISLFSNRLNCIPKAFGCLQGEHSF